MISNSDNDNNNDNKNNIVLYTKLQNSTWQCLEQEPRLARTELNVTRPLISQAACRIDAFQA